MNWKQVALSTLRWKVLALGAAAGLWATVLHELAQLLPLPLDPPLLRTVLPGVVLGLALGVLLAPVDALLHRYYLRALRAAAAGGLLGALLGAAGSLAGPGLQRFAAAFDLAGDAGWLSPARAAPVGLVLLLGLLASGCGLAAGLARGRRKTALGGALTGLLAGSMLAIPVAVALEFVGPQPWAVLGALAVWSALLGLALHHWERRRARRWLRLLSAPGEDDLFPLRGDQVTLGKHERNDIPLRHFQEIYPYHCELRRTPEHYQVVDSGQGGVVLVNFRQVQEHELKPGDLIKIGSALLQYGEVS